MEKVVDVDASCDVGFKSVEPVDRVRKFSKVWRGLADVRIANILSCAIFPERAVMKLRG